MSIMILSGKAKGLSLALPHSGSTRPTSVLLKRRIFDANQDISDMIFIDICAGVGTVGLEAISRDAQKLIAIEKDPKAFTILQKNSKLVKARVPNANIDLVKKLAMKWLKENENFLSQNENIIIYLDPPYEEIKIYTEVIEFLKNIQFKGQIWSEACRQKTMHEDDFQQQFYSGKVYRQGTSFIVAGTFEEN